MYSAEWATFLTSSPPFRLYHQLPTTLYIQNFITIHPPKFLIRSKQQQKIEFIISHDLSNLYIARI